MNKEIFIHSFETVLPEFHRNQDEINEWIVKAHEACDPENFRPELKRFCLSEKYIGQRYYETPDVDEDWENHRIYRMPEGATIDERTLYFGEKAQRVFTELYQDRIPHHLIHVTCTGYLSPSPAQKYFSRGTSPAITHAYHMGCYAALPAVRMARAFSLSDGKDVDVVHTEMCSLHLHPELHSPEQIVVQTLFADGHIKYSIGESGSGLKILSIKEKIVPESEDDMTWIPGVFGMRMTLSKEVPFKIRDSLPEFVNELCLEAGIKKEHVLRDGIFAVHPGGPKIIEAVQKKLELRDEQVSASKKILFDRGNMSSATLPHVWDEIMRGNPPDGQIVLSLAFGPGLTIFGSLFEVRR